MTKRKTNLAIFAMLALALILAFLVVGVSEVLFPTANEGSIIDKYIIPHTEEQVSIQEEEMEMIAMYDTGFLHLYKMYDNKDNVTCWIYRGGQGGGISCIPDHMISP